MILNIRDSRVSNHKKHCSIYDASPASSALPSLPTLSSPSAQPRRYYLHRLSALRVEELVFFLLSKSCLSLLSRKASSRSTVNLETGGL